MKTLSEKKIEELKILFTNSENKTLKSEIDKLMDKFPENIFLWNIQGMNQTSLISLSLWTRGNHHQLVKIKISYGNKSLSRINIAQKIAHEIRNPLTPIQLAVERIKSKFQPNNKQDIEQYNLYLETIQRQVNDIDNLTKEFSLFAVVI